MKTYIAPEFEFLCFAAGEKIASLNWEEYKAVLFNSAENPSQVDVDIPVESNPEGGY